MILKQRTILKILTANLIIALAFFNIPNIFAQNLFPATGNAGLSGSNYLKAGSRVFLQSPGHQNNLWSRGMLSTGIYWDAIEALWQVNTSAYSDFSLVRFENSGMIGFFSRESTGATYSMTDAQLESYRRLTILNNGRVGIGTKDPAALLQVNGVSSVRGSIPTDGYISFSPGTATAQGYINWYKPGNVRVAYLGHTDGVGSDNLGLTLSNANFIVNGGNVAIGTPDPKGYKLAVAGSMIAESVKVKLKSAWPDYVFAKGYVLPSLQQLEKDIQEKGHLSGIPSAHDITTNGLDLGEMNAVLLRKIEELTLFLIEQNKKLEVQQHLLERQQKQIDALVIR